MKKHRPCLRCDKPYFTTPEWRICAACRDGSHDKLHNSYTALIRGFDEQRVNKELFNKPTDTRRKE